MAHDSRPMMRTPPGSRAPRHSTPEPTLVGVLALVQELADHLDRNSAAFNRSVLFIVFAVAVALSSAGFLFGASFSDVVDMAGGAWVYLLLALITAASLGAYDRLPALRSLAFAIPTAALGASFIILDFRTRLGWVIVGGTLAATPLVVLEAFRAYPREDRRETRQPTPRLGADRSGDDGGPI